MKCEYCGTDEQKGKTCEKCGAALPDRTNVWKSGPFFYNGYICYQLKIGDMIEVQFWLGRELIERIPVSERVLREFVPDACDPMRFFWDLFLVAHGEKEVMEWTQKNDKRPATFKITRVEDPEMEWMRGLSYHELVQALAR